MCLLGFVIPPFLGTMPYFSLEPTTFLAFVLLYTLFIGIVILPSIGFAEWRKRKSQEKIFVSLLEGLMVLEKIFLEKQI